MTIVPTPENQPEGVQETTTVWACGQGVSADGRKLVAIRIVTSLGPLTYLLAAEAAENFFKQGLEIARMTKLGMMVPGTGLPSGN